MEWFEALILGVLQGLTEYLPVSSSGHLAIGSALFGIQGEDNLTFTIAVHVATVLSTLVILWKEIGWIFRGLFKFEMNAETKYVINILVSMIPIGIVGVFFKDYVEEIFGSKYPSVELGPVISRKPTIITAIPMASNIKLVLSKANFCLSISFYY
jgi:undecaprenyl-diphosphatase